MSIFKGVSSVLRSAFGRFVARLRSADSIQLLIVGYASYVLFGWLLLCLPLSHQSGTASWLDHLFTSVSAVSTTGLVTVSTSDSYSMFGEVVILSLIQLGGLGYMTMSSFVVLAVSGDLTPFRDRMSRAALSLPDGFDIRQFLRTICVFTLILEILGAAALYPSFAAAGAPNAAWQAVFHSVSAFCTAGFGLFNNSLESYRADFWLNLVVTVLSCLGAIGFIVLHDVWRSVCDRRMTVTLTTKVILGSTVWIGAVGTILFALEESTIRGFGTSERWTAAAFQVLTASTTAGFNTIPIGPISSSSVLVLLVAMVIGASPSGTGGGLKTTTFSAVWAEMWSVVRGRHETTFFGRAVPRVRTRAAVANLVFYIATLTAGVYLLSLVETSPLQDQVFECASALGTVGLSRGITGGLTPAGKLVVIVLMFVGRVGPVILGMAFFVPFARPRKAEQSEDLVV